MATPIPQNEATFQLRNVLRITGGTWSLSNEDDIVTHGVCTDSRVVASGQLFVALTGENFDGHEHLAAAAERGATYAIVERPVAQSPLPWVRVPSTLSALGALAADFIERWRQATSGRVAALTGSAGKTTTKAVLGALAEVAAPEEVHVTQGNLNNRIGVPMTAFGLLSTHRFAIFELGTSLAGEIAALSRIVRSDVGMLTLIAAAHTEGIGDVEAVAVEKRALFEELAGGAVAVANADDARVVNALKATHAGDRVTYGTAHNATYRIHERAIVSPRKQRVSLRTPRGELTFHSPLLGATGALACAGALAACDALVGRTLQPPAIEHALLRASEQLCDRMSPRELEDGTWIIDDSYNANPASCRASIATAKEIAEHLGRRLVLVLGEMRELGSVSVAEHRALGQLAAASADLVICVGGDAEHVYREASGRSVATVFASDSVEAAELATERVEPRDVVLVKGSRGVRTERVVDALTRGAA